MTINRRTVNVEEVPCGWQVGASIYDTACEAFEAIKAQDAADARNGISTITEIQWFPVSRIGRLVVKSFLS